MKKKKKTKSQQLQQLLDDGKPPLLLKSELENRLLRYILKQDDQVEKTIQSMTERYRKAPLWNAN